MAIKDLIPWRKKERKADALMRADRDFEEMFREFFEDMFHSWVLAPWRREGLPRLGFNPDVDVSESDKEYNVSIELPGLSKDEIEVSLDEGSLIVSGEKREGREEEKGDYVRVERSYGSFRRRISLPAEVDESAVEATYKNGVLRIKLPKSEDARGERIKIK